MWFTPKYSVVYRGQLRQAGRRFQIADDDADEMRAHGNVQTTEDLVSPAEIEIRGTYESVIETKVQKRGRPKKNPTM